MAENIEKISTEIFAVLQNVDSTICGLNPYLNKFGYVIEFIPVGMLEKRFYKLFTSEVSNNGGTVRFNENNIISEGSYQAMQDNPWFSFNLIENNGAFFIKSTNSVEIIKIDHAITPTLHEIRRVKDFVESIITQLRLFKKGHITSGVVFQIETKGTHIYSSIRIQPEYFGSKKYELTDKEVLEIGSQIVEIFKPQEFMKTAFDRFHLSYRIPDATIRFFTLNVVLESVFKKFTDNAGHQIARCSAYIITKDTTEMEGLYKEIKLLYKTRSKIAHGGDASNNILKKINRIEFVVRKVLRYVIASDYDSLEALCDQLDSIAPK